MSAYVVWIDSKEAKIFELAPGEIKNHHLKKHEHHHHTAADGDHHKDDAKFFHDVSSELKNAKEILLMGPGQAKNGLKTHFETHHHHDLAKSVVGIETVDHPTDNQILATARKFFKSYDLFEKI